MGKQTGIGWTDDTVNPTSGCDGCELWTPNIGGPCYAGNLHENRLAKSLPTLYSPNFSTVKLIPGRMAKSVRCMSLIGQNRVNKPWLNGLARKLFVGDLGDIFSKDVPFDYLKTEIIDIALSPEGQRHDFQLLTKQPQRALQFSKWLPVPWPDNVWIGASVTGRANTSRIQPLVQIPAKVKFLSLEPLRTDPDLTPEMMTGLQWLIVGGESDQGSYRGHDFDVAWARKIITLGKQLEIAVFIKQLGSHPIGLTLKDRHGEDWTEWAEDVRVREMPFNCR